MQVTFNNRPVEIEEVSGTDPKEAEAMIAYYIDTGAQLTDEELEAITQEHYAELYQHVLEKQMDRAEDMVDAMKDRLAGL